MTGVSLYLDGEVVFKVLAYTQAPFLMNSTVIRDYVNFLDTDFDSVLSKTNIADEFSEETQASILGKPD